MRILKGILRGLGAAVVTISIAIGLWGFLALDSMSRYHASIDSEGGTFVYGMMSFMYLGGMFIGVLLGSMVWGIGILGRADSSKFQRLESTVQRVCIWLATVPLILLAMRLVYVWVKRNAAG